MKSMESFLGVRKVAKLSTIVAVSTLAFTGCSKSNSEIREDLAVVERIDFDFGGGTQFEGNIVDTGDGMVTGNSCLDGTPYDPVITADREPSTVEASLDEKDNLVIRLIPSVENTEGRKIPISLTGFDNLDDYLQPADDYSKLVMELYGCLEK